MGTAFSKHMQDVAFRLLHKYGSSVKLIKAGAKVWDPVAGEYNTVAPTEIDLTSAVPVSVSSDLVNGTTIRSGDIFISVAVTVKPTLEDKIFYENSQWSIVHVGTKVVNDDVIAYIIQVRK